MQIANINQISCLLIFAMISCNLEVNTVNPQVSESKLSSMTNGFFVSSYYGKDSKNQIVDLEDAWIEYCWKNEASLLTKSKVKTQGLQVNLQVKGLDTSLDRHKYLKDWRMEVDKIGVIGRSNDIYTLYLNSSFIPDSISVQVKVKVADEFKIKDYFTIYRSSE